jgi:alpha-beta hydrolase superfamily lysophospholipase
MKEEHFFLKTEDTIDIYVYHWLPDKSPCRGIVHIIHGMAEHGRRYTHFARALTAAGYGVYAQDLRGHGKTAKNKDDLGYFGKDISFDHLVSDIYLVSRKIYESHPGVPVFIFGHSLGSMITLRYCELHGKTVHGAIIMGTGITSHLLLRVGTIIINNEIKKHGETYKSPLLYNIAFGNHNKPFKPNRTEYDWLSRDTREVDTYVKDPLCGFFCSCAFYNELTPFLLMLHKKASISGIPADLPLYLCSGDMDPVGNMGKDVKRLSKMLKAAGVKDITRRLYAGARHELINETNRDEVTAHIIEWLGSHLV